MRRLLVGVALVGLAAAALFVFPGRQRLTEFISRRPPEQTQASAPGAPPASVSTATPRGDVSLDLRRRQLIGVRTTTVSRGSLATSLRTLGVVRAPETRLTDVNVKIEGWIRDLQVDYTGQSVTKGQPLFSLYSPEVLATEREFVLALKSRDQLRGSVVPETAQRTESLIASARQRLQLFDVSGEHIARLERTLEPEPTITFRAPVSGFVLEKTAVTGMHVTPGQTLYRLADLGVVWIEADAYEHDLPVIRMGATGRVTIDAYPNERLTARVVFISQSLQPETRTAKVRFEVQNLGGRLKPGMYANVEIATSAMSGLVVPVDAVLDSGREQIVFVAEGDGNFMPRPVTTGTRGRDTIEIVSGLKEGDQIATSAAFFLDSESQLRAGVSGYESPTPGAAAAPTSQLTITLRSQPDPPKTGENAFEVSVKDPSGQAVADAQVSIQFFMPAMPTMNMPAMRNTVTLAPAGGGIYRGTGEIMMAGRWEATVTVSRSGQRLASLQVPVVAR